MLPAAYDIVWSVAAVAALVLAVVALVLLVRDRRDSALTTVVWLVAILAFPLIGPLVYLAARRDQQARATTEREVGRSSR